MRRVVVIGTSLGGREALRELLGALPADYPLPIAVVQHQGEDAGDSIVTALRRAIALPVREAEDKLPLAPGTVVVAPPGYHLLIEGEPPAQSAGHSSEKPAAR